MLLDKIRRIFPVMAIIPVMLDVPAATIALEAANQPIKGQIAVGYVLLTRAQKRRSSPEFEALRAKQFSCWNASHEEWREARFTHPGWKSEYATAYRLWGKILAHKAENPFPGATHYHVKTMEPYWANSPTMTYLGTIGDHKFYREG